MPYREPDPSDPSVLVGVELPADVAALREMAYTFAEEFAALGYSPSRILNLFRKRQYAAAHAAYQTLGDAEVQRIVNECAHLFGQVRVVVREAPRLVQIRRRSKQEVTHG